MSDQAHVQHRVTWFPPDVPQRSKSVTSEAAADALMEEHAHEAPLLEVREIGPWTIVRNPALDAALTRLDALPDRR